MNWRDVWKGNLWVAQQATKQDGRIFERVLRAPGSRILIINDGKLLLNREKRQELEGKIDFRLPGGKVFDSIEEFEAFLLAGKDIIEASRTSIIKEALEETGLILKPENLEYLGVDVIGTTVSWDLHYWVAKVSDKHPDGAQFHDSESEEIVDSVWEPLDTITEVVLDKDKFSESRSAAAILRFIGSKK